jgi:hypothetical protein
MYVSSLATDLWEDARCENDEVSNPSWEDIENAIRDLDGKSRTIVSLQGEDEAHLVVGGGSSGRYLVYATFDNKHFSTLSNGRAASSKMRLYIGGQVGEYADNLIVDIACALSAARCFSEFGQLDPKLAWHTK